MMYQDGEYRRNSPSWHAEDSPWKAKQVARILAENDVRVRTVLDIGCGAGGVLAALASDNLSSDAEFVGLDVSRDAIDQAIASHQGDSRLQFRVGSVEDTQAGFDLAMLVDVIEHVEDYFALLRNAGEAARLLVAHIPIELTVSAVVRRRPLMAARRSVGHIHMFNRDMALATLRDSGFEIVDWFYTPAAFDIPSGTFKGKLALGPRRILAALSDDLASHWLGGFSMMVLARSPRA